MYEHFNTARLTTFGFRLRCRMFAVRCALTDLLSVRREHTGVPFIETAAERNRFGFPVAHLAMA